MWGMYIPVLKSALGKFLFKLCLQKVFPDVFPDISWFLTNVKSYEFDDIMCILSFAF